MMGIFTLASRNIRRNKRRTALTFAAITVGITAFMLSSTIISGIDETSLRNYLRSETAHAKIMDTNYFAERTDKPLTNLIYRYESIVSRASAGDSPRIRACARLKFAASVIRESDELFCSVTGIDPARDGSVFNILPTAEHGALNAQNALASNANRCLIGKKLAAALSVVPGDEITVNARTRYSANNADTFTVADVFFSDNPEYDSFGIVISLPDAMRLADTENGVSEIAAALPSRDDSIRALLERIRPVLPSSAEVYGWRTQLADVLLFFTIRKVMQRVILVLLLLVAVAGVTNTMLMAVFERTKEIGTLAAMGMKQIDIVRLFIAEGMLIGIVGSTIAIVITFIPVMLMSVVGIPVFGTDVLANVPVSSRLYGHIEWWYYPGAIVIGTAVSVAATLYPSMKAASLNIAAVLRGK
ncbi:MAG: FtsX-like permease family protein [Spirochaetota bacterium]